MSSTSTDGRRSGRRTVGAFDIRFIIATLLGIYGVVLVIMGIVNNTSYELGRADGVNVNLYAGIGMIVVSALFAVWARLKPTIVPDDFEEEEHSTPTHG